MNLSAFVQRATITATATTATTATTTRGVTTPMTFVPIATSVSPTGSSNELDELGSSSESHSSYSSSSSAPSSPKSSTSHHSEASLRHPRKRRSAWEIERLFPCEESSKCSKKYGSASALRTHVKKKHPERLESFDLRQSSPAKVVGKKSLASLKPLPLSKFRVTSIGSIHTYLNNQPHLPQVPRVVTQSVIPKQQTNQKSSSSTTTTTTSSTMTRRDSHPDITPLRSSFSLKCNLSPSPPLPPNPASIEHVLCGTPPPPPSPCNPLLSAFYQAPVKSLKPNDVSSSTQEVFSFLSCELDGWKREKAPGKLELFAKLALDCDSKERSDCLLVLMMTKEAGQPEGYLCMKINFTDITNLTVEYGMDIVRFHIDTQSLQLVVNSRDGRLDAINDFKNQHLPKLTPKTANSEDKKVTLRFERAVFAEFVPLLQREQCLASKFHIARPITSASPSSCSLSSSGSSIPSEAKASFSSNVVQSNNR